MSRLKLLVVDDCQDALSMTAHIFEDEFDVVTACDGLSALESVVRECPDIMLLDIELPDIKGYEVCARLRKEHPESGISVLFVSGHNRLEDILQAYQAGGDDFVAKPYDLALIRAKVGTIAQYHRHKQSLLEQQESSQEAAYQSMLEASSYGNIVHFFRDSLQLTELDQLPIIFFSMMRKFGLLACIQIREQGILSFAGLNQQSSPLEDNLFEALQGAGRMYRFNQRCIFNERQVSVLVKNMPEDEDEAVRIGDFMNLVVQGLQVKINELQRRQVLDLLFARVSAVTQELAQRLSDAEQEALKSSGHTLKLFDEIEQSFNFLDLSDEQEKFFSQLMERSKNEMDNLKDYVYQMEEKLKALVETMENQLKH